MLDPFFLGMSHTNCEVSMAEHQLRNQNISRLCLCLLGMILCFLATSPFTPHWRPFPRPEVAVILFPSEVRPSGAEGM